MMTSLICKHVSQPTSFSTRLTRLTENFPVVVVSGARQVGKTTLLKHLFPQHDYCVFDASLDLEGARRDPDLSCAIIATRLFLMKSSMPGTCLGNQAPGGSRRFRFGTIHSYRLTAMAGAEPAPRRSGRKGCFLDLHDFHCKSCPMSIPAGYLGSSPGPEQFQTWSRTAHFYSGDDDMALEREHAGCLTSRRSGC